MLIYYKHFLKTLAPYSSLSTYIAVCLSVCVSVNVHLHCFFFPSPSYPSSPIKLLILLLSIRLLFSFLFTHYSFYCQISGSPRRLPEAEPPGTTPRGWGVSPALLQSTALLPGRMFGLMLCISSCHLPCNVPSATTPCTTPYISSSTTITSMLRGL